MNTKAVNNEGIDNEIPHDNIVAGTGAGKGKATKAAPTKKAIKSAEAKPVVIAKVAHASSDDDSVEREITVSSSSSDGEKAGVQNNWTEAAETQLSELISHYRSQGYAGPVLWDLISSKCEYNFSAEQCMSKWYREKTKERYKTQGKKRKEPSTTTLKWNEEGTVRLNASVELIKGQEFEGSKLWNLVAESLDLKWTAAQCMNKYYRDRHKLQKVSK
jgi:hypothetical protein